MRSSIAIHNIYVDICVLQLKSSNCIEADRALIYKIASRSVQLTRAHVEERDGHNQYTAGSRSRSGSGIERKNSLPQPRYPSMFQPRQRRRLLLVPPTSRWEDGEGIGFGVRAAEPEQAGP